MGDNTKYAAPRYDKAKPGKSLDEQIREVMLLRQIELHGVGQEDEEGKPDANAGASTSPDPSAANEVSDHVEYSMFNILCDPTDEPPEPKPTATPDANKDYDHRPYIMKVPRRLLPKVSKRGGTLDEEVHEMTDMPFIPELDFNEHDE